MPINLLLELDPPCQFDLGQPLSVAGHLVTINHAEPDKVWVDPLPQVEAGVRVVQTRHLGSLPEVFEAFHIQWKKRWCKHDAIPNSQWQDIVDFASRAFPQQSAPVLVLDGPLLPAEIHRENTFARRARRPRTSNARQTKTVPNGQRLYFTEHNTRLS